MNHVIGAVGDIHELLGRVRRKADPARGADCIFRVCAVGGLTLDPNIPLEIAHLVENLDAIAQAVAYIDQPVVPDHHTVHWAQEYTADARVRLSLRRLTTPLTEIAPFPIKDHDAFVPIPVGNVHVAIARVDRDLRRLEERSVARIQAFAGGGAVRAVHY